MQMVVLCILVIVIVIIIIKNGHKLILNQTLTQITIDSSTDSSTHSGF